MKALYAFTFLILSANASASNDKIQHAIAGLTITSGVYIFTDATIKQSLTVGFLAGVAKEVYDSRKGGSGFDVFDMTATGAGAVVAGLGIKYSAQF